MKCRCRFLSMMLFIPRIARVNGYYSSLPSFRRAFPITTTTTTTRQYCQKSKNDDCSIKTVGRWKRDGVEYLGKHGVLEPEASVWHLLAFALDGLEWETGFVLVRDGQQDDRVVKKDESDRFESMLKRRAQYEPLQYILGQWDFLDHVYIVRRPLLCPRPETEELVLLAEQDIVHDDASILDVGCGTGVIGIELAKRLKGRVRVTAIDVDPVAVETSMENARRILKTTNTLSYRVFQKAARDYCDASGFHLVVSNPPYIPSSDMSGLDPTVAMHESPVALMGGGTDGMNVIKDIVRKLPEWSCQNGAVLWMEVDPSQPTRLQQWLQREHEHGRLESVRFHSTHCDLFGKERFVKLIHI